MKLNFIYLAALALLILLCPLPAPAQDYEIHLEQPSKAGDKYSLSATGNQRVIMKLTSGEQIVQNIDSGFTLELTAEATVLTVDAGSMAISKSFTITSSKLIKDGMTRSLLPKGSIIVAKLQAGQTLFEMEGKPVEDDVAKALSAVISLHSSDSINDEAMFRPHERKRVGETWNLNIEATLAFIKELGGQARKEDIKGTAALEEAQDNHLTIRSSLDVVNVLLPLSAGYKAEKGEIHSEFFSKLPLPNSDGSVENRNKLLISLTGRRDPIADKPEVKMNLIYESSGTFKTIPIKQNSTK